MSQSPPNDSQLELTFTPLSETGDSATWRNFDSSVDLSEVNPALLLSEEALERKLEELDKEMHEAAEALDFERAASVRDRIQELKRQRVQGVA